MDPKRFDEYVPKRPESRRGKKTLAQWAEETLASRIGGERDRASGSGRIAARPSGASLKKVGGKGDVRGGGFLWEVKATSKKSISLKKEWLVKITREARDNMRRPGLCLTFSDMPVGIDEQWAVLPLEFVRTVLEQVSQEKNRNF